MPLRHFVLLGFVILQNLLATGDVYGEVRSGGSAKLDKTQRGGVVRLSVSRPDPTLGR